jgi:hypothetical protein
MHIVLATAEPRAAYHIAPLLKAAGRRNAAITHLVPSPEPVQGHPWPATTSDPRVLETADRIVLTGGSLSAWTEIIARLANERGVPVRFVELATVRENRPGDTPRIEAVSAVSPATAAVLSERFRIDRQKIRVTGTPLLDEMPAWTPRPRSCVLYSTVAATDRDPRRELWRVGDQLVNQGWDVKVRCHPREDRDLWARFALCEEPSPAASAARARIMIGYPGTAHAVVAALGCPVIALAPAEMRDHDLSIAQQRLMSGWCRTAEEVIAAMATARPAPKELVEDAVGPVGGAAERIISFILEKP